MEHEIQNRIREYISFDNSIIEYDCSEPFADTSVPLNAALVAAGNAATATCYEVGGGVQQCRVWFCNRCFSI